MSIGLCWHKTCRQCERPLVSQRTQLDRVPAGWMRHGGRGLCTSCHSRHREAGTLIDFERRNRPASELLEEWLVLKDEGYDVHQAEERLGLARGSLVTAIWRQRKRQEVA